MKQTFSKSERLCSQKLIESLFDRQNKANQGFLVYPIRVVFQQNEAGEGIQVMFTVSKRNFKKAVDRNIVRRRMREAYRKNKYLLEAYPASSMGFIFVAKEILDYATIEKSMRTIFRKLMR